MINLIFVFIKGGAGKKYHILATLLGVLEGLTQAAGRGA